MNHQVLLADDSITIQKVIKITLANQPYDITEASSEEELFEKLPLLQPKIVFLDFNLSDNYTGYELCSRIHDILPETKILLLLGTFDTVDDAQLEKCGASEKIVKPFDSNKFIAFCRQLIEAYEDQEPALIDGDKTGEIEVSEPAPEDQWEMNVPAEVQADPAPSSPKTSASAAEMNPLTREVSDWGMMVPGVIGGEKESSPMELPPVIGAKAPESETRTPPASGNDQRFPESSDLDYPSFGSSPEPVAEKPAAKKPQLVSIDTFASAPEELELEGSYVEDKVDIGSLEAQIHDEVAEDLWQADEFEELKDQVSSKIEELKSGFQPSREDFDDSLFKPLDEKDSIAWNDVNSDIFSKPKFEPTQTSTSLPSTDEILRDLRPEIEDLVKACVKEYLDEMFRKNVEKISWEVIPDLAENLIRQELGKISDKILSQSK